MKRATSERPALSKGTALMATIIMMVFIATALISMTLLFTSEARRTRITIAGAQLRQLLLAAQPAAQSALAQDSSPRDIPLVTPVPGTTLVLHLKRESVDTARVRAVAHLGTLVADSETIWTRRPTGWQIDQATLGGMQ